MDVDRPDVLELEIEAEETGSTNQVEENVDLHVPRIRAPLAPQTGARGPSPRVRRLLLTDRKISDLNASKGDAGVGPDGKPLGTLSRDYDFAFIRELILRGGITDPVELTEALRHRADDAAQFRGDEYINNTVASALEAVAPVVEAEQVDFSVSRVVSYPTDPAYFELTIDGEILDLSSRDLLSRSRFRRRFMDALGRVPALPSSDEGWREFVDALLRGAERVEQPFGRDQLREEVVDIIALLPIAASPHRLDSGDALLIEGERRAFKMPALLSRLAKRKLRPSPEKLTALLTSLGFEQARPRVHRRQVRVWLSPPGWNCDNND